MLSVFTHMWEEDIAHYLREVRSIIAPNGPFVFTAFILGEQAKRAIAEGKSKYQMAFSRGPHCRYTDDALLAVAYEHVFLDLLIRQNGFTPDLSLRTLERRARDGGAGLGCRNSDLVEHHHNPTHQLLGAGRRKIG